MTTLFGTTTAHWACDVKGTHMGHDIVLPEGEEDYCKGRFVVLDDFDSWIITQDPDTSDRGWLEHTGPQPYEIDSERIHEIDWQRQLEEKTWLQSKTEFAAALRAARVRWPL